MLNLTSTDQTRLSCHLLHSDITVWGANSVFFFIQKTGRVLEQEPIGFCPGWMTLHTTGVWTQYILAEHLISWRSIPPLLTMPLCQLDWTWFMFWHNFRGECTVWVFCTRVAQFQMKYYIFCVFALVKMDCSVDFVYSFKLGGIVIFTNFNCFISPVTWQDFV